MVTLRVASDEHAHILFLRMLSRRAVWVDSPAGQMTGIQMIALDDDGEVIAFDLDGSDRPVADYLLSDPGRSRSEREAGLPQ